MDTRCCLPGVFPKVQACPVSNSSSCDFLAVWPGASSFPSLCLGFRLCTTERLRVSAPQGGCEVGMRWLDQVSANRLPKYRKTGTGEGCVSGRARPGGLCPLLQAAFQACTPAGRRGGRTGSPGSHSPVTPPPFSSGRPGGSGRSLSEAGRPARRALEVSDGRSDPKGSEPAQRPSESPVVHSQPGAQNQVRGGAGGAAGARAPAGQGAGTDSNTGFGNWRRLSGPLPKLWSLLEGAACPPWGLLSRRRVHPLPPGPRLSCPQHPTA